MKILFLTNNKNTLDLVEYIRQVDEIQVFSEKITLEIVQNIEPDFIISYNYRFIVAKSIIDKMQERIINLHISLLPWNKGSYPNLWSIIERTPVGVTIHRMSEGLDEGEVLVQKEVEFNETVETLSSSYDKLHSTIKCLFKENWVEIKNNRLLSTSQQGKGSKHTVLDTKQYLELIPNWEISIAEFRRLIDSRINNKGVSNE